MKILSLLFLFAAAAAAQTFQGSLRGRVVDPNGSPTEAAVVTLTEEGTSAARKTLTSDQGEYVFASLTPATYSINVDAAGFKRIEQRGVAVATQAVVTLDFTLQLGAVTEEVDVTASAPLLGTQSAGYVQQYSLEVQRQVPAGFVLTAGFLGSHSLHLLVSGQNIDQLNPSYFSLGSSPESALQQRRSRDGRNRKRQPPPVAAAVPAIYVGAALELRYQYRGIRESGYDLHQFDFWRRQQSDQSAEDGATGMRGSF